MTMRIFFWSFLLSIVALVVAFVYGGWTALALCLILGILEVSLSFDNAVINATVLERMSEFWQKIFLTVGIVIAVFGMRLLLPLLIVYVAAGLNPVRAFDLAMNPPADGAAYFADGSPSYETLLTGAHPIIASFGGMFLLMLFLSYIFEEREITWLSWLEKPLARIGKLDMLSVVIAGALLVILTETLITTDKMIAGELVTAGEERNTVLVAGILGMVLFIAVNGLGQLFESSGEDDEEATTREAADEVAVAGGATTVTKKSGRPSKLVKATGKAGFFLFLYLEVLDASFSFDGVIGAFAITSDPIIIALGLGIIGALFVRSLTIFLVRKGTLSEYVFLEHGAHWAIFALAVILLISVGGLHVPEVITGLVGVAFIGAALLSSLARNRRLRAQGVEPSQVHA
ncbi:DUF475 domain-containing protein [Nakamurella sp. A5-74]|uniref:DUF475 domain-containing protein n=1 Tax=Nakamurella sp. A5-74 TaxID=3158264 RepID=A0AAU8DLL7_9ACTN